MKILMVILAAIFLNCCTLQAQTPPYKLTYKEDISFKVKIHKNNKGYIKVNGKKYKVFAEESPVDDETTIVGYFTRKGEDDLEPTWYSVVIQDGKIVMMFEMYEQQLINIY